MKEINNFNRSTLTKESSQKKTKIISWNFHQTCGTSHQSKAPLVNMGLKIRTLQLSPTKCEINKS